MTKARTNADNVAGDISGVTAGTGLTGGGTSGTVTLTNDMATTINAAGDLIYGTGNDAYTRLGIGSSGQYLTVSGGVPAWGSVSGGAGNVVQIATGSLTGASVTISSLSSYTELFLLLRSAQNATNPGTPYFRINNNSGSNYNIYGQQVGGGATTQGSWIATSQSYQSFTPAATNNTVSENYIVRFFNCKNAGFTSYDINSPFYDNSYGTSGAWGKGIYTVSETVSSLVIANTGGNWNNGTYTLWGA